MAIKQSSFAYTAILAGIGALPPLSIDMNLPAIPEIEAVFQAARGQGSLTLSLFLLGFSVAPLLGGPLSDRYGRKRTLLVALLLGALAAFGCALGASFHLLLLARLIQGVACGVCVLVPLAIVRDTQTGAAARRKLSAIMFVGGVAPLLAPILGGWLLLAGGWLLLAGGWASIYGVQGALSLVLFGLVAAGVAETLPPEKRNRIDAKSMVAGYRSLFSSPRFLAFALAQAFAFGCMFSYIAGSPGLMLGEMGLTEQHYSYAFACTSCGVLAGSLVSGILGRWEVHARSIIATALVLMVAAVAAVFVLTWGQGVRLLVLLPLLFVVMGCFGVILPNAMSEAVAPWGNMAGAASGAVNALQMLVGAVVSALTPLLTGWLEAGRAMGLSMLCTVLVAAGVYAALVRVRRSAAAWS
jgi:DHA1 family bicyclomycin/chloramphenicol resistance-like MFS transporter